MASNHSSTLFGLRSAYTHTHNRHTRFGRSVGRTSSTPGSVPLVVGRSVYRSAESDGGNERRLIGRAENNRRSGESVQSAKPASQSQKAREPKRESERLQSSPPNLICKGWPGQSGLSNQLSGRRTRNTTSGLTTTPSRHSSGGNCKQKQAVCGQSRQAVRFGAIERGVRMQAAEEIARRGSACPILSLDAGNTPALAGPDGA
ncbi:hypothetical protein TWF696_009929 [Orbilia brochopaga]|uniref:Uncharacterized protein n=1 Tax=Orbilia brochopaga TaxID=3140254 RepID=A0AAV9UXI4_9PEZI